jgi:ferritin-like metal-binding protein YciE
MREPRELFLHELKDIYYVEKSLTKTLPRLAAETKDRELASGFKAHLRQTERHAKNIEKIFKQLGEPARAESCPGFDGIKKEHDDFVKEHPSQPVLDVFLTGAAARTEHYEIAAYTGLVTMAKAMGEPAAAKLLEENLKQEKETLRTVEKIGRRLSKSVTSDGRRPRPATRKRSTTSTRRPTRSRRITARAASGS